MEEPIAWSSWIADTDYTFDGRGSFAIKISPAMIRTASKLSTEYLEELRTNLLGFRAEVKVGDNGLLEKITFPSGAVATLDNAGDGFYFGLDQALTPSEFMDFFFILYYWDEGIHLLGESKKDQQDRASCDG